MHTDPATIDPQLGHPFTPAVTLDLNRLAELGETPAFMLLLSLKGRTVQISERGRDGQLRDYSGGLAVKETLGGGVVLSLPSGNAYSWLVRAGHQEPGDPVLVFFG